MAAARPAGGGRGSGRLKMGERMKMGIVKDRLVEAVKVTLSLPPHSSFSSSALPSRYLRVKRKPSICHRSSTRRRWRS
jgi:hypothetical protein